MTVRCISDMVDLLHDSSGFLSVSCMVVHRDSVLETNRLRRLQRLRAFLALFNQMLESRVGRSGRGRIAVPGVDAPGSPLPPGSPAWVRAVAGLVNRMLDQKKAA
jgi:hypothetical protein